MFNKLTTAVFVLLAIFGSSAASAADPFDISDRLCRAHKTLRCAVVISGPRTTIGNLVEERGYPLDHLQRLNQWKKGDVTMDTVIPIGKKFALSGGL